jgi:nucleotide-binding universal stress UspA family protein
MPSVKKMVVAVDGSDVSIKAFEWALELACIFGSEIIVVTVSDRRGIQDDELYPAFLTDRRVKGLIEEFAEKGEGIFKDIKSKCNGRGVKVSTVVLHGLPSDEIVGLAQEQDAGLIVMGAHGKKEEFYHEFSSTAERVLKKSSCPVLMVVPEKLKKKAKKKKEEQKPYTPILYST